VLVSVNFPGFEGRTVACLNMLISGSMMAMAEVLAFTIYFLFWLK